MLGQDDYLAVASANGFALFVKSDDGEIYTQISGGHRCQETSARGHFVRSPLSDFAEGAIEALTMYDPGLTVGQISKIDIYLQGYGLRCDERFFHEDGYSKIPIERGDWSQEAWIHVFSNAHGPCILVSSNCD